MYFSLSNKYTTNIHGLTFFKYFYNTSFSRNIKDTLTYFLFLGGRVGGSVSRPFTEYNLNQAAFCVIFHTLFALQFNRRHPKYILKSV